jgi:hypothetical protein
MSDESPKRSIWELTILDALGLFDPEAQAEGTDADRFLGLLYAHCLLCTEIELLAEQAQGAHVPLAMLTPPRLRSDAELLAERASEYALLADLMLSAEQRAEMASLLGEQPPELWGGQLVAHPVALSAYRISASAHSLALCCSQPEHQRVLVPFGGPELARLLGDVAVHDFLAEHGLSERGLAMLGLFLRTVVAETGSLPAAYEDDQP